MKKKLLCMAMILLLSAWITVLTATNPSSDNYILQASSFSGGNAGGNAPSSANYILQGSVFGIITGVEVASSNYNLLPGYYLGIDIDGELLPPENVTIWVAGGQVYLEWSAVSGATSYKIYVSENPHSVDWGDPVAMVGTPAYSEPQSVVRKFYRIVASTDIYPVRSDKRRR